MSKLFLICQPGLLCTAGTVLLIINYIILQRMKGYYLFPGTYDSGMVGLCNIVFPIFLSMLGPLLPCITVNIFKSTPAQLTLQHNN